MDRMKSRHTHGLPDGWVLEVRHGDYHGGCPYTLLKDGVAVAFGCEYPGRGEKWGVSRVIVPESRPMIERIMRDFRDYKDRERMEARRVMDTERARDEAERVAAARAALGL